MCSSTTALVAFLYQIEKALKPLKTDIGRRACNLMNEVATASSQFEGTNEFIPSQLEEVLGQHSSPELQALAEVAYDLAWTPSKTKAGSKPLLSQLAAVELIGPTGIIPKQDIRAGLLIQPSNVHYPQHRHAAEELYLVLSGHAHWGQNLQPTNIVNPGSTRHHASWEWHQMITDTEPLLALWCWVGDIRFDQYEIR